MKTGEIFVSRDVVFHEETYPYANIEQTQMTEGENVQQICGWN